MGRERELTNYKADLLGDLKDPVYAALYLANVLEGGSSEEFRLASCDVAGAHKMGAVAQTSNLNRETRMP